MSSESRSPRQVLEAGLAEDLREVDYLIDGSPVDEGPLTLHVLPPLDEAQIASLDYPAEVLDLLRVARGVEISTLRLDFTGQPSEYELAGLAAGPLVEVGYLESFDRFVAEVGEGGWGPFWRVEASMLRESYVCATLAEFIDAALDEARLNARGITGDPPELSGTLTAAEASRSRDKVLVDAATGLADTARLLDLRADGIRWMEMPKGSRRVSVERIYSIGRGRGSGCIVKATVLFVLLAWITSPYVLLSFVVDSPLWIFLGGTAVLLAIWFGFKRVFR